MSIRKQYLKNKPVCKVTFKLPKEIANGADAICVAGDFNNWDTEATPMAKYKNGSFSVTVALDINREYQFRYLINDRIWENDAQADKYAYCDYGNCENSVIVT